MNTHAKSEKFLCCTYARDARQSVLPRKGLENEGYPCPPPTHASTNHTTNPHTNDASTATVTKYHCE